MIKKINQNISTRWVKVFASVEGSWLKAFEIYSPECLSFQRERIFQFESVASARKLMSRDEITTGIL